MRSVIPMKSIKIILKMHSMRVSEWVRGRISLMTINKCSKQYQLLSLSIKYPVLQVVISLFSVVVFSGISFLISFSNCQVPFFPSLSLSSSLCALFDFYMLTCQRLQSLLIHTLCLRYCMEKKRITIRNGKTTRNFFNPVVEIISKKKSYCVC